MQVAHINTNGLNQIAAALGVSHKLGRCHFTAAMLSAWAAEAEASYARGDGMSFEVKMWVSPTGCTEFVTITADGFDVETMNDE